MYRKYPRTPHLPWSEGATDDDKRLDNVDHFIGHHVIITEKMDGENTTLYNDGHSHARSLDSRNHLSRDWVKNWWSSRSYLLPQGWYVCGENLFAKHSIHYKDLKSYFYGFSVWDSFNTCTDWMTTTMWFDELDVVIPRMLYNGIYDQQTVERLHLQLGPNVEGFVVRLADDFKYDAFGVSVAKWVRKDHVQTEDHWMHSQMVPNELEHRGD